MELTTNETTQRKLEELEELEDVIEFCKRENLPAVIVGAWVWIEFESKPDAEVRAKLKAAGFRWIKVRGMWAHNCGVHRRRGIGDPRMKYGSIPVDDL